MQETADITIPLILQAFEPLTLASRALDSIHLFLDQRTRPHQPLLRPYLVRLAYELCGGRDWRSIVQACAAAEILNISSYQANVAFDGKLTIATQEERARQFGCAMLSLDCAQDLLARMGLPSASIMFLIRGMQHANREMYLGQIMDLTELQIDAVSKENAEAMIDIYSERCRRLGGAFTAWCLGVGGHLAGASELELARLSEIGIEMGTAGQMVNDIGDYVATTHSAIRAETTRYQHVFSDVLNGKATYPILHAFAIGAATTTESARRIYREQEKDLSTLYSLSLDLRRIGAFDAARLVIRRHYSIARHLLRLFPRSTARSHFAVALTALTHNKYFTSLRIAREADCPNVRNIADAQPL